ncbi:phage tail tape measure protein [Streptococcus gallolyticus]|jgi:TP901 family phage tail tape measure protein|uniref:phage tail tape measure protein n=1 Tax=Streptococcus gallolyticus TaxID=315405 RepID=UPI000E3FA498|nr:phage tail tape measure protein [Streptococcus gallolyticus]RGC36645.1 phage tail tape measure protein [Streptococcus gallolyticus]
MSSNTYTVEAVLKADASGFTGSINNARSAFENFTKGTESKLSKVGDSLGKIGSTLNKRVTVPVATGLGASVKIFQSFDDAMRKVAATSGIAADSSSKSYVEMRKQAEQLGASTRYSASEVAEGMNYMAMAGWSAEQTMAGIPAVLDLAAASGENLGTTSDIVTDAMTAFGMQAEQAGEFADILAAASSNANTNVSMMGDTFKYVAPVAGSLGFNAKDTAIAIGLMANSGIKGSQAGTALRAGLVNLVHPSEAAQKAMDSLGISVTDSEGNMKSFRTIMGDLREKMGGLSETQKASAAATIFGKEAMSGWLAIINSSDGDFNKLANAIDNSQGATKRMVDTMEGGIGGSFRNLRSAIEGLGIAIGDRLAPYVKKGAEYITQLTNKLTNLSPEMQDKIIKFALIAAAIGPALIALKQVVMTIKNIITVFRVVGMFLTNPWGLLVVAIVGAVAAFAYFYTHSEKFRASCDKIWQKVQQVFSAIAPYISAAMQAVGVAINVVVNVIKALIPIIANVLGTLIPILGAVFSGVGTTLVGVWNGFITAIVPIVQTLISTLISLWQGLSTSFSQIWDGIKQVFQGAWEIIKTIVTAPVLIICDLITGNFGKLGTDLQNIWTNLTSGISSVFGGLVNILSGIWSSITTVATASWTMLKTYITSLVSGLVIAVTGLWNGIKTTVSGINSALHGKLSAIWNGIVSWFSGLWSGMVETFSSIWTGITEAPSNAAESIKNVWNGIKEWFSNLWNGIKETFSNAWQTIQSAVLPIIQPFIDIMLSYWNNLSTAFSQIWDGVKQVFRAAWEIIKSIVLGPVLIICDLITGNFSQIGADLQLIWNSITTAASTAWNGLLGILTGIWNAIVSTGSALWQGLCTAVTTLVSGLVSGVVGLWNGLYSAVVSIANAIASGASAAWSGLCNGVSSLVNGLVGTVVGLWNGLRSSVVSIAQGLVSGAVSAFNGLVSGVSSIVSSVKGVLNSLANINLAGAGQAIMNGFLGGLKSAWGAVQNFVGGIADWIRAHKGPISYDRVLLRPAGRAIMRGFDEGLNSMFGQVQSTVRDVTGIFEDFSPVNTISVGFETNTKALSDNLKSFREDIESNIADFNAQIADMMTDKYSYQFEYGKYSNNIEVTYKNQEGEKLEVIKEALATVRSAVSRDTVLNINGREFARATGDDTSAYQNNKQHIENLVWGIKDV